MLIASVLNSSMQNKGGVRNKAIGVGKKLGKELVWAYAYLDFHSMVCIRNCFREK